MGEEEGDIRFFGLIKREIGILNGAQNGKMVDVVP